MDEELANVPVGNLYPSRRLSGCVVDAKGLDDYAVERMIDFIKESGLTSFFCKNDKENSMIALMAEANRRSGGAGCKLPPDVPGPADATAVPEKSAVGESASNGRAEPSVQASQYLLHVHKLALEARSISTI